MAPLVARSRGAIFFVALVVLTIAIGFIAYRIIDADRSTLRVGTDASVDVAALLRLTIDEETGVRGYLDTGARLFLEPYDAALQRYPELYASLAQRLALPEYAATSAALRRFDEAHAVWERTVLAGLVADPRRADRLALEIRDKQLVDAMRAQAHSIQASIVRTNEAQRARTNRAIVFSIAAIVLLTIVLGSLALQTEIRRAEQEHDLRAELAARNAELEQSNRSLEEFAYVASHDLQEPLRTVASFAELLQRRYEGRLDAQADEFIHFMVDGATRMRALINDVLEYSRVTTRGTPLAEISLGRAVGRAVGALRRTIEEHGAIVDVPPLPTVLGDEGQLAQVFQNLIGNALKYNHSQAPRVRVRAVVGDDGFATVSVADNGIGIAPEYHDQIFKIFTRLHTRTEYEGTGIGLAICKRIVERHGGRIWIASEEGNGTTIFFTVRTVEGVSRGS